MTDDLDTRIRALVRTAVADAPAAPPTPRPMAPVAPLARPGRSWGWAAVAMAAAAAVVAGVVWLGNDDTPDRVVPATDAPTTALPAPSTTVPSVVGWREDLVVIIASDAGIERVWTEQGAIAQAQISQPLLGEVAFELPDGTIVSGEDLMDVGLDGTALYAGEWSGFTAVYQYPLGGERPDTPLMIPFDGEPTRLTYSPEQLVGEGELFAGGRTPIRVTQDGQFDISTFLSEGITPPLASNGDDPRLFSVSPTGRTIGWIAGDEFVVAAAGRPYRLSIPDGSKVVEVDLSDTYVAFTRADGPGTIVDLRNGDAFTAPSPGRITLSLAPVATGEPGEPSTTLPTPTTTEPLPGSGWRVVTAGPDGVTVRDAVGETVWTTEPMATAMMLPDGTLVVQRAAGYPGEVDHTMGDTLPLRIAAPGDEPVDFFGDAAEPVDAWYTVHDAATVNGRDLLLFERQYTGGGFDTEPGDLLVLDLATGEATMVDDQFGGWEQGSTRLRLATTGLIVGEYFDSATGSLYAIDIDGGPTPSPNAFGLEPYYGDCSECPRRYTVSSNGDSIAWLDGTELVLHSATGSEEIRFELGETAVGVADMALGDGYVVLTYGFAWQDDPAAPVVVQFAAEQSTSLSGRTATAVE